LINSWARDVLLIRLAVFFEVQPKEGLMTMLTRYKLVSSCACCFLCMLVFLTFSKHALPKVQAYDGTQGCTVATLNGHYGQVLKGEVLGVGPIVAVGVTTFDGRGHFAAEQTINLNGNVQEAPLNGTYTVNSNCTGIADAVGAGPHSFVIVNGGKEMDLMNNNSYEVLTIHFTKINDHED
jgi:hypothetical protein